MLNKLANIKKMILTNEHGSLALDHHWKKHNYLLRLANYPILFALRNLNIHN